MLRLRSMSARSTRWVDGVAYLMEFLRVVCFQFDNMGAVRLLVRSDISSVNFAIISIGTGGKAPVDGSHLCCSVASR